MDWLTFAEQIIHALALLLAVLFLVVMAAAVLVFAVMVVAVRIAKNNKDELASEEIGGDMTLEQFITLLEDYARDTGGVLEDLDDAELERLTAGARGLVEACAVEAGTRIEERSAEQEYRQRLIDTDVAL